MHTMFWLYVLPWFLQLGSAAIHCPCVKGGKITYPRVYIHMTIYCNNMDGFLHSLGIASATELDSTELDAMLHAVAASLTLPTLTLLSHCDPQGFTL